MSLFMLKGSFMLSTRILSTAIFNSFLILVAQFTVCDKLCVVFSEVSCFFFLVVLVDIICIPVTRTYKRKV
jgi:hypothetical protein